VRAIRTSVACERVHEQVSLELDSELSQLERRMVAAHLERCADCRAFRETVRRFTEELRAAPLEVPRRRPVVVARPRRISLAGAQLGAAATLAIAALGLADQFGMPWSQRTGSLPQVRAANLFQASWTPEREIAQLDAALEHPRRHVHLPGPVPAI